jgi:hypothetical protein
MFTCGVHSGWTTVTFLEGLLEGELRPRTISDMPVSKIIKNHKVPPKGILTNRSRCRELFDFTLITGHSSGALVLERDRSHTGQCS